MDKPRIIATIGPRSSDHKVLWMMQKKGMNIARINTKYCKEKEYSRLRKSLKTLKINVLFDIKGMSEINWILKEDYKYVAVSFSENARQIRDIRKIFGKKAKIIAKIENMKGVRNAESIMDEADGIMIARGDLGRNVRIEKVPIIQKHIIKMCKKNRKIGIVATEMLYSMVSSKEPERAEVSDVANAVLDGCDMVMLSEETAIGKHPSECVAMMSRIIDEAVKWRNKVI